MSQIAQKREIIDALQSFGLNEKETRAYIALLEIGNSSAYALARVANLKLSTTYVILDSLIEKSVVVRVPRTKKRLYAARLPNALLETMRGKINVFAHALPLLVGIVREKDRGARMHFYEGVAGVRQGLNYRLKEMSNGDIEGFYGAAQHVSPKLNSVFLEWNEYLASHNIQTRAIVPDHPSLSLYRGLDKEHNRRVKLVPYEQYSSDMSVNITPFFVMIITFGTLPQCVIIESKDVAKTFKQIFEMLWELLPVR